MEQVLPHPDIVNPYGLDREGDGDRTFFADIGLGALLASVPFHCAESRKLAEEVLVHIGSDLPTVDYRQGVLGELILDRGLRTTVQRHVKALDALEYKLDKFHRGYTFSSGLELLRSYRGFVDDDTGLSGARATALREVDAYLSQVRDSGEFSRLRDFLERIDDLEGVDFRISLDRTGRPIRMSALELAEGRPERKRRVSLIERLTGRKEEGQSLAGSGGQDNLGKIIQEFLDKEFAPVVKAFVRQIGEVTGILEPLDFYAGFAEYFARLQEKRYDVCRPTVLPVERRRMSVRSARNPLLAEGRNDGRKVVPNDIEHDPERNVFVITGPNNGGKTTYVKTVGLVQLLSQKGLFVPAQSAEVSLAEGVYTHFVAPDDLTKGEGRYRNELRRMKEIFERATPFSLVILDEPCGGTSFEEGQRQSLALLDGFHRLGSTTYFTTHMHMVAREVDSGRYPAAKNLSVECSYDGKRIHYTYKVREGAFGKSFGEEIAREIGLMPEGITETISKRAEEKGFKSILRG